MSRPINDLALQILNFLCRRIISAGSNNQRFYTILKRFNWRRNLNKFWMYYKINKPVLKTGSKWYFWFSSLKNIISVLGFV